MKLSDSQRKVSNIMAGFHLLFTVVLGHVLGSLPATSPPHLPSPCLVDDMEVFCDGRNLRSAPADLPLGIQKLDLSRNIFQNLTRETLAIQPTIHHLNLRSNKILFIERGLFKGMKHLKFLDLSKNSLDVFAMSKSSIGKLGAVESLDLSGNGLHTGMTKYFLRDSSSLVNLSLNSNSLTKIAKDTFTGSPSLRKVSLHNNVILEIEDGAFNVLFRLTELDLSKNSITCITDFDLSQLQILNLSKNSLEAFQTVYSDSDYELVSLDLSQNKIHYFPLVPRRNKLAYLDVSRNKLQGVNTTGTAEEIGNFREQSLAHNESGQYLMHQDFPSLNYLDLSYNQMKTIPQSFFNSMVQLEHLNISNNCIGSFLVEEENGLNNLKVLDLSYNSLRDMSFGKNTLLALEELFLQGNLLTTIEPHTFQGRPRLKYLLLQQNNLHICPSNAESSFSNNHKHHQGCVAFSSIPTLQHLYLSENHLKVLPNNAFEDTPLTLLDLSLNPGLVVGLNAFSGLEDSLVHLLLRENHISRLDVDLSSLNHLKLVDLSTNRLSTLPSWNKESSIESLNLGNNHLVTLEYNALVALGSSLKTLYMGSNPLSCCSNLRFFQLMQHSTVDVPDIATVTCVHKQDSEPINILRVTEEMCHSLDNSSRSLTILAILGAALALVVALGFLAKVCYNRRHTNSSTFNA
ncbi:transforming growth factor beta activator LRRC32-like [Gadus chalcogrammus]|uniref:transforming growth factor beta activator LRRC32-like n=1 Tax=Gadus chalcogrammus TaxID=1042646 RepID=UPI0024C4B98B|nr:transforming growth factor beta activator LRRC32-like [Gadus chalcogrammus]